MDTEVKKYFYGRIPDLHDNRDLKYKPGAKKALVAKLPPEYDLRPNMPKIIDQKNLGKCTACATAGQVEFMDHTTPFEPSTNFIYYNTRMIEGTTNYDSGASIRDSIKSVVRYGFCSEEMWPSPNDQFKKKPSNAAYSSARKELITHYRSVKRDPVALKTAISQGFPVNFGFTVYESFEGAQCLKTGIMPMPASGERKLGGHAVLISYFSDVRRVYGIRNSWGTSVHDNGYFYMPYDFMYSNNCSDFWIVTAAP